MNIRILIFAGGGIGDVLMTTPMFRAIKEKYPDSFLSVGVSGKINIELLSTNNKIDLLFNSNGFENVFKFILFLRKYKFDYCFHNHCVGGRLFIIIPFLAGIKNRIGFNKTLISKKRGHNLLSNLYTKSILYIPNKNRRIINLSLLKEINIDSQNYDYELDLKKNVQKNNNLIGIHPGSDINGRIRRWDIIKFNELAQKITSKQNFKVKFYIGPQEKELIKHIDECHEIQIVQGKSLIETIEDIATASYFISNDSGLSHISAALKIPTVVIFGPTLKEERILPTNYIAIENDNVSCRPCWYDKIDCINNYECLSGLTVDFVYNKFRDFVKSLE